MKKSIPAKLDGEAIIYWDDGKSLYYLPEYCEPHSFWLGEAIAGEVPADKKHNSGLFSPGWLQIKTKDKRVYYRKILRFSFWKVKRDLKLEETLPMTDDRVIDYFMQLESDQKPRA